ncbi:hypothetical protein O8C96_04355 [Aliarcobacter butzleri]|uniref:hypothetical protein n=1 Tax=Aliarcobacter butzleri TaxID=28197 RepID=UPI00263C7BA9|nr:hypothetical protein [Aliarcobacter butzleri]MDN5044953.1 hypothetical protein [Aliarcobacter butzleri]
MRELIIENHELKLKCIECDTEIIMSDISPSNNRCPTCHNYLSVSPNYEKISLHNESGELIKEEPINRVSIITTEELS